ncbi:probable carboxylesterase 16 [Rutidosis leptorrhynchoides]|uniref:probable carboxylesterase 16 n=1 Tax=Rutidosis leptorrhynchoides TaxID=125765 RepID=UPI003A9A3509
MPSVSVKLYSLVYKFILKRHLQTLTENPTKLPNQFGVVSRSDESFAPSNPSFSDDGVATKDIHIDPLTSLSLRIFLPDSVVAESRSLKHDDGVYGGYSPELSNNLRKLPVVLQFHGGGFVTGSSVSFANDLFCRRIAKACDAIVVAVGYRLAPESKFPAAFEDGVEALNWLAKQLNLAECRVLDRVDLRRRRIVDGFGSSMIEPWIAAHADLSRCVLLGVSSGSNIANYVTQKAVEARNLLDPIRIVAQVLMYPFVIGNTPTKSEIKLANSYLYDRSMAILAWKLFLPDDQFNLDHPAANPLMSAKRVPLKQMPPTLTIVAEHDWMRDRAIAYSQELRKVNVDAPVYDYKDAVHEFATFEMFLKTPKAQACVEDIAIWVKKYISLRGLEFSY